MAVSYPMPTLSNVIDNDLGPGSSQVSSRRMNHRRTTIADVAERAGVSVATVSKVLNNRWGVAPDTYTRVRHVIEEMGYSASLGASSLRSTRTNVIAVLVTEIEPFSAELLKGVSQGIHSSDYELLIYVGGRHRSDPGWERQYVSRLSGTLADGMIIVTPASDEISAAAPVVAVDPHDGLRRIPCITSDNYSGAKAATAHLVELGHRRIAFLAGRHGLESSILRERGFRDAMAEGGVPVDETLVQLGGYRAEDSVMPAHDLLEPHDRPTAVFAANDQSALEIVHVAVELGLDVPGDLSVVGFDNIPESALSAPPLTTVAQPIQQMGIRAVETLIAMIGGAEPPPRVTLPTEFVLRQSTAPPSSNSSTSDAL